MKMLVKILLIMSVMLAFALSGYILRKKELVQSKSTYSLSNLLLCFAQPMLAIKTFALNPLPPSKDILLNFLYVFLFSALALLLTFFVCKSLFSSKKHPAERKKKDILVFIGTFSNCAFVGIPLIEMLTDYNPRATAYLIIFNVAFNLLFWTLGAYLITQDKNQISLKKALFNPCTLASFFGFLLFLLPQMNIFKISTVKELQQIVVLGGGMTAPISMLIVGVRIAELSPKRLFCDKDIYWAAFARLVLSAGLTYLLILPFKIIGAFADDVYVLLAPVVAMSMPPSAGVVAFAEKLDGEKEFAAAAYATGTLLSVISLPIILTLVTL